MTYLNFHKEQFLGKLNILRVFESFINTVKTPSEGSIILMDFILPFINSNKIE